ncbi:MAG: hypothetical protein ISS23_02300 [Nanoarchaeota archaeon]|nr:hypothetical protein [Nanoarchaeota archaeon]
MESALEYMARKHVTLINDYRTPCGNYSESCGIIAIELAERLLSEGKEPYIMKVAEDVFSSGFITCKVLKPLTYEGRIRWGAHQVCCWDGKVYDPILDKPVSLKDYFKLVFGEEVEISVLIPSNEINEYISRGKSWKKKKDKLHSQ